MGERQRGNLGLRHRRLRRGGSGGGKRLLQKKDTDITVKLIGGDLVIRYTDDTVYMTGNAVTVYEGVVEI